MKTAEHFEKSLIMDIFIWHLIPERKHLARRIKQSVVERSWSSSLQNTPLNKKTHYHVNLSIGVSHVADDAAVLHSVKLFPSDNILVT